VSIREFHILSKLGEGTYSEVFRAVHKATGFLCAIKILEKWKMIELNVVENVLREIKINYFLDHPNIAKIHSFFDDRNYIYLICEYATDRNIFELINQPKLKLTKGLFADTVSKIIYQLCDAVRFIHNHSVIHRDIKPENILITMVLRAPVSSTPSSSATSAGPSTTPPRKCGPRCAAPRCTWRLNSSGSPGTTRAWTSGRSAC
jgi:serine/threonine protein kinase